MGESCEDGVERERDTCLSQAKRKKGAEERKKGDLSRVTSLVLPLCGTGGIICVPGALLIVRELPLDAESDERASTDCRSALGNGAKVVDRRMRGCPLLMAKNKNQFLPAPQGAAGARPRLPNQHRGGRA